MHRLGFTSNVKYREDCDYPDNKGANAFAR